MTTQNISAIAIRFLALWLLIQLVCNLPNLLFLLGSIEGYIQKEVPFWVYISTVVSILLIGLTAAYLMYKSSEKILSQSTNETPEKLSTNDHKFFIQLLGLYFVVTSLTRIPVSLSLIQHSQHIEIYRLLATLDWVLQLIFGVFLIGSVTYWSQFLNKLRDRG
ncbi:MAG: hypothetical protein QS748_11010 [Candidatus Endonucleobacter bathymodioli]|uniref:Uncharacterized protein n=1 Tax=Candidatus Endonucleibacter bathymodioli TaxID=539814 RepID=A0AA90P239_9GAMM|nr:hypothetical protein [Candidatus Endonucleobacter bathymodioli]